MSTCPDYFSTISAAFSQRAAAFAYGKVPSLMMIFGLVLAVLGLVCAMTYSSLVGLLFLVVGGALLAKGYYTPAARPSMTRRYESGESMSYDISSKPRR